MADLSSDLSNRRHSPLEGLAERMAAASGAAVRISEIPFLTQVNLRGDADDAGFVAAVKAAVGLDLPARANTVMREGDRTIIWLGPDEWMIVGPDGSQAETEAALRRELGTRHAAVTDVSANRTTLELAGPAARAVLAKGCGLDLHPRTWSPGDCAQTLYGRAQIILEQTADEPAYRILVRNSFAAYVAEFLLEGMREFAPAD